MAGYAGSAESQNWQFYFSGRGNTGRCQHPNSDFAPHITCYLRQERAALPVDAALGPVGRVAVVAQHVVGVVGPCV